MLEVQKEAHTELLNTEKLLPFSTKIKNFILDGKYPGD